MGALQAQSFRLDQWVHLISGVGSGLSPPVDLVDFKFNADVVLGALEAAWDDGDRCAVQL